MGGRRVDSELVVEGNPSFTPSLNHLTDVSTLDKKLVLISTSESAMTTTTPQHLSSATTAKK